MKYNKIIATVALCFTLGACDFLETEPQDFIPVEQFFKTEKEAFMALSAVYNGVVFSTYTNIYPVNISGTDDLGYYDRNTFPIGVYNNNHSTSDGDVLSLWRSLYAGINNANLLLEQLPNVPKMPVEKLNLYTGEAKFLRAYAYFLLAQCWGDVPYKTESQKTAEGVNIVKSTQQAVLENVVKEMEEAEKLVGEIDEVPAGRVNKSAVRGILARVYLKMAGWPLNGGKPMYEKANYWAKQVNKDSKHQVNPDYAQIFINLAADIVDTKYRESIWEAEFKGNRQDAHHGAGRIGNTIGIKNGDVSLTSLGYCYGFISCTLNLWDFYNDIDGDGLVDAGFEEGSEKERNHPDQRRDWNIAPFVYGSGSSKSYYKYKGDVTIDKDGNEKPVLKTTYVERNAGKYRREYEEVSPRDKNNTPINYPILRYSDVLLMIAESENEIHEKPTAEACNAINELRTKRIEGVMQLSENDMDYATFKQFIKDERARELCFESLRKYDLIRWGDDYLNEMKRVARNTESDRWSAAKKFAATFANSASERFKWLPIPNRELGLNSLLTQHPAWK